MPIDNNMLFATGQLGGGIGAMGAGSSMNTPTNGSGTKPTAAVAVFLAVLGLNATSAPKGILDMVSTDGPLGKPMVQYAQPKGNKWLDNILKNASQGYSIG